MYPVVVTIGTFDMLHPGHLHLLRVCRSIVGEGGKVIVGVNGDAFVRGFKGQAPVQSESARMSVLSTMRSVDVVRWHNGDTTKDFLVWLTGEFQAPHRALVVGSDWASKDYFQQIGMSRIDLARLGFDLLYVDIVPGFSNTNMRETIRGRTE